MKPSLRRPRSPIVIALLLSLTLVIGLFMGWLSGSVISKDKAFRSLTRKIFQEEISGSMLTLHYSLAYPEKNIFPDLLPPSERSPMTPVLHIRNMSSISGS